MTDTTAPSAAAARRATQLWTTTGIGLLLYIVLHVLATVLKGVPAGFAGVEDSAMWVWTIALGIAFLPTLLSALGESRVIGWIVFALGILTVLLGMLLGYQYGVRSGAGYLALAIAVFVLVPAVFALVNTFRWALAK
ncbi:hypothetical protein [Rathayibacter sp. VKM Ac-2801]|uniref:hypothetical protein n=1 Tax=Rathayibacter sp. VKM Ac-2801 TaxID=2609255 RepID=UPI001320037C|nr:hypothetical protein [Rathayibacter sp. VKM Ac-2801]QHC70759.1 hypothetical protein GSU45_10535 [Rathayibacter sp. VKM Ac-2801]